MKKMIAILNKYKSFFTNILAAGSIIAGLYTASTVANKIFTASKDEPIVKQQLDKHSQYDTIKFIQQDNKLDAVISTQNTIIAIQVKQQASMDGFGKTLEEYIRQSALTQIRNKDEIISVLKNRR